VAVLSRLRIVPIEQLLFAEASYLDAGRNDPERIDQRKKNGQQRKSPEK
jgi:hypothetical protein